MLFSVIPFDRHVKQFILDPRARTDLHGKLNGSFMNLVEPFTDVNTRSGDRIPNAILLCSYRLNLTQTVNSQ